MRIKNLGVFIIDDNIAPTFYCVLNICQILLTISVIVAGVEFCVIFEIKLIKK